MTGLIGEFGTGQVLWSMLWFFLFIIWIYMLFVIFADIFRSDDLGGWGKALWVILIIVMPYLGVLVYLIARGRSMQDRALKHEQRADAVSRQYVRSAAGSGAGAAEEISRLADLKSQGVLNEEEFQAAKARALSR
jgi:type VI protein secretion system component VasK